MKKRFNILLVLIIAFLTLPFGNTVLADGKAYDDIKDGEYDITAKALNKDTGEKSGAAGFINEGAKLSIQAGEIELTITIPDNEMAEIKGLQVEDIEPKVEEDEKAKYMTFKLDSLESELSAQVQYEVPSLEMNHDVSFKFVLEGLDELPGKEDKPEQSDEPEEENNELENDENKGKDEDDKSGNDQSKTKDADDKTGNNDSKSGDEDNKSKNKEDKSKDVNKKPKKDVDKSSKLDKGHYTINASYLKTNSDEKSAMGSYLDNSAFLSVENGKVNVTITVDEDETVTKLQIDGKNATEKKVDGDKRYETFVLEKLPSTINAYVEYQAPFQGSIFKGDADFDISFDKASLKDAKASDKPGYEVSEPKPEPKKKDPKKEKPKKGEKEGTPKPEDTLVPDKAYTIDYVVKHGSEDKASAADSFFKKPAYLLYKNDEKYIQLTVTNSDMIKSLSTTNGDVVIVEENKDGSMVIQFKVDGDLSDVVSLNMFVSVPDMPGMPGGYDMEHNARLFLDPNSKKEVDAAKFLLVASKNDNGPNGEGHGETLGGGDDDQKPNEDPENLNKVTNTDNTNDTPEKPEFGSNGDNGKGSNTGNGGNTQNPQTGDTSNILLYALLLIGSFIPLGVKFKRRFI